MKRGGGGWKGGEGGWGGSIPDANMFYSVLGSKQNVELKKKKKKRGVGGGEFFYISLMLTCFDLPLSVGKL